MCATKKQKMEETKASDVSHKILNLNKTTFESWMESQRYSINTIERYQWLYNKLLEIYDDEKSLKENINVFITKNYHIKRNFIICLFNLYFEMDERYLKRRYLAPKGKEKKQSIRNHLSVKEFHLLYNGVNQKYKLIITLFIETGLRGSELLALKPKDFEFDKNRIFLKGTMAKGSKENYVYYNQRTGDNIKNYITINKIKETSLIFPQSLSGVDKYLTKYSLKILNKVITTHSFRHSLPIILLQKGVPFLEVKEKMRHTDPKTTMEYVHFVDAEKKMTQATQKVGEEIWGD